MAVTGTRTLRPRMPDIDALDWRRFRFELDRRSDTLYWDFFPDAPAAIVYPVTDHLLYGLDPETEVVIGLQFEGFLAHVVHEVPAFLTLADDIGMTEADIDDARLRTDPGRRQDAMRDILVTVIPRAEVEAAGSR